MSSGECRQNPPQLPGPGQHLGALLSVDLCQPGLQRTDHRRERDGRLTEMHARAPEHLDLGAQSSADLADQPCLPHPGLAVHHHCTRTTTRGRLQSIREKSLLDPPASEPKSRPRRV